MFSPASLWAYTSFRLEEEKRCDDLAVAQTGLGLELASALLKFMKYKNGNPLMNSFLCLLPGENSAVSRIRRLMAADFPKAAIQPHVTVSAAVFLLFLLVFLC